MQAQSEFGGDLRTLARAGGDAVERPAAIPRPRFAWKSRVLLPATILLILLLLLGYTAQDALWPARGVTVVPVVVKTGVSDGGGAVPVGTTVQAPGWVEPDPYPISVAALADGVVR